MKPTIQRLFNPATRLLAIVAAAGFLLEIFAAISFVTKEWGKPTVWAGLVFLVPLTGLALWLKFFWESGGLTAANDAPDDTLEAVAEVDVELPAANEADPRKSVVFLPYSESVFTDGAGKKWRQIFGAEEAKALVTSFNSLWGKAARLFGPVPIFAGHPDVDPEAYKQHGRLGEIVALNEADGGVSMEVEWTDEGVAHNALPADQRRRKPSPVWRCRKKGDAIHPYHLLSVGLTNTPNIKDVPAWNEAAPVDGAADGTADGAQAGGTPNPSDDATASNENIVAALRTVLEGAGIVQASDSDDTLLSALGNFLSSIQYARREAAEQKARLDALRQTLGAANEVTAAAEARATTAQALADKTTEAVTAANAREEALREALVASAVTGGAIAEADRPAWLQRLAEDVTAINALPAKGAALNVAPLGGLSRQRPTVTAANEARQRKDEREKLLAAHQKEKGCDRLTAWNALALQRPELFDTKPKAPEETEA